MNWVQFSIRLEKDDHAKLKQWSERERRSLNGQVSKIITEALERAEREQARADAR